MLTIPLEHVCDLILKARAYDANIEDIEGEKETEFHEEEMEEEMEEYGEPEDSSEDELISFIEGLNEDEQLDLVALVWIGRGDFDGDDWADVREEARDAKTGPTSRYLLGMPLLGDYLEEGLAALGYSCES